MAVMQMRRVNICALHQDRKAILEKLQKNGWMEIDREQKDGDTFRRMDTVGARNQFQKELHQTERALEILGEYAPEEKVSFAGLRGKPVIEEDIYDFGAKKGESLLKVIDELIEKDKEIIDQKAIIQRLENQKEELAPWLSLTVPMSYKGTKKSDFFVGTISAELSERQIEEQLSLKVPECSLYSINVLYSSKDMTYLAVVVLKQESKALEDGLRKIGFSRPSSLINQTPKEYVDSVAPQIKEAEDKIAALTAEISTHKDLWFDLKVYADYCRLRVDKYEVLGTLPQTKNAFAITGYMPAIEAKRVQEFITDKFDAVVEVEEIGEEEDAPVVLKNGWFGSIGESTVTSYAFPGKGEIDPSTIMMVFYVIFFGLMLSDAAYGAILSIATGIALWKFPRMPQGIKSLVQLFFLCGFSTLFWGIMFGGYFGDAFDVIASTYLGIELNGGAVVPAAWFTPLNNPMRLLMFCLLFGLIHMFMGMFIKGYQKLKNKDYKGFVVECLGTVFFVLGLILMLLPTSLFESIAQMEFNFPAATGLIAKAMVIAGAVIIILFSSDAKNPALRVLLGVYEIYNNITGWLSDTLSYSRLLALGLATGVIASVINQMGSMGGKSVVGIIVFVIVFIFGHIFNMAINLLGAYVHTCRLQYVEFFNKFYDGGGRKFSPYFADTKYVDIHEGGQNK